MRFFRVYGFVLLLRTEGEEVKVTRYLDNLQDIEMQEQKRTLE